MSWNAVAEARNRAGLSKAELARRAGTSRPTLSAYENGRVSPTLETLERVLAAASQRLELNDVPSWTEVALGRGRMAFVPDRLWRLSPAAALGQVEIPLHLEWSRRNRTINLSDRQQRFRLYESALREGRAEDIERFVDGALLVDSWDELIIPAALRRAWQPLINQVRPND